MIESSPSCDFRTLEQISYKVVEASPDAKIVINTRGQIIIFNYQAELLFGCDRGEVLGQPIEILLPDALGEDHKKHRANYFREPRVRDMGIGRVLKGKRMDGTLMNIEIKLAPIIVQGAGLHALAVVRRVKEETE